MATTRSPTRQRQIRLRRTVALATLLVVVGAAVSAVMAVADEGDVSGGHHAWNRMGAAAAGARAPASRAAASASTQPDPSNAPLNIYSHTLAGMLGPVTSKARYLVYVPDSQGDGVYVINPLTFKVIRYFQTGAVVQHVVPAWDLRTLYATNDVGNSLTPINPDTGVRAGPNIPVADPYNMYFTPDGRHAIVVEEAQQTLAFRDPHSFKLQKAVHVDCAGVDHMDFSADGRFALASCEFSGQLVRIDLRDESVSGYVDIGGAPQDVKLSADGKVFYVANKFLPARNASGVQLVDARTFRVLAFIHTAPDAHGLYVSRNTQDLYVTDRAGGAITVIDFATRRPVAVWRTGGTPDMGGVSPDGRTLWVAGRYSSAVYAISTRTGRVISTISVGVSPHGLCVWPQPGRYSTGHTGVMR